VAYDDTAGDEPRIEGLAHLAQSAETGVNAVLRSVGSLLVTLGGIPKPRAYVQPAPGRYGQPGRAARREATAAMPEFRPEHPRFSADEGADEIELVLSDARDRAHELIEESVQQARQMLERRSTPQAALLERLGENVEALDRRVEALHGFVGARIDGVEARLGGLDARVGAVDRGISDVHDRIGRIEALIADLAGRESRAPRPEPAVEERRAAPMPRPPLATQMAPPVETPAVAEAAVPPVPQTPPPPPTPAVAATPVAASEPAVERAAAALAAEPAVPAGAAEPAVPAGVPEPSVAPAPRAEEPRAEEQVTVAALPAEPPRPSQASPGEPAGVEFDAGGGTLAVRVFPISGFQGLMRVQDALARVDSVRAATVEAYAQGEARLRLQLGDTTPAGSLAAGLTRRLGQQARVRAASIADRSLLIVLE
jgi:hypothetical protein